jgi:DNA-3-methyladenine glycosylase II
MNKKIVDHFTAVDSHIASLIPRIQPFTIQASDNPFISLVESIISQQLSVKAGDTIMRRFLTLFPKKEVTPETVLVISREQLRGVGMSWNKADYIHNIAQAFVNNDINIDHLQTLGDEELITKLTTIKGIGRWTAEMFLMFTLGREDVFSAGDVGLQRAMTKLYGFKNKPSPKTLIRISNKWKPYRTYACKILWRSLD